MPNNADDNKQQANTQPSSRVSPFLTGSPLDFIYQARDPRKRQVKPVDKHYELMQLAANLEAGDSSDDEEYVPKELNDDDDEDDDDANDDDGSAGNDDDNDDDDDDDDEDQDDDDEEGSSTDDDRISEGGDNDDNNSDKITNEAILERLDIDLGDLKNIISQHPNESSGDIDDHNNIRNNHINNNHDNEQQRKSPSKNKVKEETSDTTPSIKPSSPHKSANLGSTLKICSVCLGDHSRGDDEIIECDSCGIPVHESCYGVLHEDENDNQSVHSNISSESTEPWFCEPCKREVKSPTCDLCPNSGGIFKQTDSGRWVHMVCALYIQSVSFADVEKLSGITLFEINYAHWGSKACTICEDIRLAKSGICIGCDAGLCKTYFHVTCAQKEGLLFESHGEEVDPYFAHCKQHADKTVMKQKRRTCLALQARLKHLQGNSLYVNTERTQKKLELCRQKLAMKNTEWNVDKPPPVPFKVNRMLMTSPAIILKLSRKSELLGLEPNSAFMTIADEMEAARRKWHIPPAFNLEFIAYVQDRSNRISSMKKRNAELVNQNAQLKLMETQLRTKYDNLKKNVDSLREQRDKYITRAEEIKNSAESSNPSSSAIEQLLLKFRDEEASQISLEPRYSIQPQARQTAGKCRSRCVSVDSNQKSYSKSRSSSSRDPKLAKTSNTPFKSPIIVPEISTHECGKCKLAKDQHLLSLCDTCRLFFHIYCLDPPLTRVPKKTKFGGWQCSDCAEKDDEEQDEANEEQNSFVCKEPDGPRRLRERIKSPDKYTPEGMLMADLWARRTKNRRSRKRPKKKVKIEAP